MHAETVFAFIYYSRPMNTTFFATFHIDLFAVFCLILLM